MPDYGSMNPTEIMKYEIIGVASYDEQGVDDTSYKKYIGINSSDSEKYLVIKVPPLPQGEGRRVLCGRHGS